MSLNIKQIFLLFLVGFFSALSTSASAEDFGPVNPLATELQNLIFYPHKGQYTLSPQASYAFQDSGQSYDSNGVQTNSSSKQHQEVTATLVYGIAPRWRLSLSESWLIADSSSSTNLTTGNTNSTSSYGPTNPTIIATYRYHETEGDGLQSDVAFQVVPGLGTKDAATSNQNGTENGGAWQASVAAPFYWVNGTQEFEASPSLTHFFGGSTSGTTANNSTLTSPYWQAALAIDDRIRLSPISFIQPILNVIFPYSYTSSNQSPTATGAGHTIETQLNPSVVFGYLSNPTTLWTATVAYAATANDAVPLAGNNSQSKTEQATLTVQARFLF